MKIIPFISRYRHPLVDESGMRTIVEALFPVQPILKQVLRGNAQEVNAMRTPVNEEELLHTSNSIQNKKQTPGPDSVSTEVVKVIARANSENPSQST